MMAQDAHPAPKASETPTEEEVAARRDLELARETFHAAWDGFEGSSLNNHQAERQQIRSLLEPHLAKVFGGDQEMYKVGFFTAKDLGGRESIGYRPLTIGMFPRDERNKPTWTDAFALRLKLLNHADGTIRWGSRGETFVCVIRHDIRKKHTDSEEALSVRLMDQHVRQQSSAESKDGVETEVEITREAERVPRARPGRPPNSKK